jgi:peptidoglycan/xylan/chitin deacetylase (PgdA/CDA1 family)
LRILARRIAYRAGVLGFERARCPAALTVVMFHRVIDSADPDFEQADPVYTVAADLFDELLSFFVDHYSVVGLSDVIDAANRRRPLPRHPLLITFDDGWADNLRYGAPLLRRRGLPAVIFVVAEALLSAAKSWWQEQIFAAARRGSLAVFEQMMIGEGRAGESGNQSHDPLELICRLAQISGNERSKFLESIALPLPSSRMMLAPADLPKLAEAGFAIGNHGYTHLPLTRVRDIEAEIRQAITAIAALTGDPASAGVLSFPHGRYDADVILAARAAGVQLIFTSDPLLNPVSGGFVASDRPIGRISVPGTPLTDRSGRLDRSAAATWLWRRPFVSDEHAAGMEAPRRAL